MRCKILLILPFLSACGMDSYRPQLTKTPANQEQYEVDLKRCIGYSKSVRSNPDISKSAIVGALGPLGYIGLDATKDRNDPYFKNGYELTDECLIGKGYALK